MTSPAGPEEPPPSPHAAQHAAQVFPASAFVVRAGVNLGDDLSAWAEACAGDVYRLEPDAEPRTLRLALGAAGAAAPMPVAAGSQVGRPGETVALRARLALMAATGETAEGLVLEHLAADATPAGLWLLPLSPLWRGAEHTLLRLSADPGPVRLAELVCLSFGRGTRIALPDGRLRAIETLAPGDAVLTRDHGPQPLRWVGHASLRARGAFAPVVIAAGAMGNAGDLVVSQHHRMFLYQRRRPRGAATSELLVQARHLVDGDRITLREGGFVDYYSLVFDRHEIVYAEGIPAESLLVNDATLARLPEALAEPVRARFPGLRQRQHFGTEAGRALLERAAAGLPQDGPARDDPAHAGQARDDTGRARGAGEG